MPSKGGWKLINEEKAAVAGRMIPENSRNSRCREYGHESDRIWKDEDFEN